MAKTQSKKTVFVGMSGGVDSSVSAALLKKEGYDVVGAFMKVWSPDWLPCTWRDERRDAMRVAAVLDIPLLTFDFEHEYKQEVVDYMLREYAAGRTPNPDVMCNKVVKFGAFLKKAREMGADYIATGHYAQIQLQGESYKLQASSDKEKDQSYFLWTLTQDQLQHSLFPIGHLQKSEVRALAAKFKLPVAEKKDSQGLCFIGHVDMKEFLGRYLTLKQGDVLDGQGRVIGIHDGAAVYTLGERHGFTVTKKTPDDKPYYIVAKDHAKNTLTVSHGKLPDIASREVMIESISWTADEPDFSKRYKARVRYRQSLAPCSLVPYGPQMKVVFDEPQVAVTPGQSMVIYDGEVCLGGAIIA